MPLATRQHNVLASLDQSTVISQSVNTVIISRHFHGYHSSPSVHHIPAPTMSASSDHRSTTNWPLIYSEYEASFSMYLIQLSNLSFPHEILCFGTGEKKRRQKEIAKRCTSLFMQRALIINDFFPYFPDVQWWNLSFDVCIKIAERKYHTRRSSHKSLHARWGVHEHFNLKSPQKRTQNALVLGARPVKGSTQLCMREKKTLKDHFIILVRN